MFNLMFASSLCAYRCANPFKRMVLYMIYYPTHLKYRETRDGQSRQIFKAPVKTDAWDLSLLLFWIVIVHLYGTCI